MDDYESLGHSKWECTTEARSVAGDRIYQRKECDTLGSCIRREEAKFCWPALLGEGPRQRPREPL